MEQEQEQDQRDEYIFSRTNEEVEGVVQMSDDEDEDEGVVQMSDDNDEDGEDDEGNSIIVISSDDDEEGENNYNTRPIPGYMMNTLPERPALIDNSNLETFSNNLARSVITSTISAATATATTTTITSSTLSTTTTVATTTRTPLQRCCICLTDIVTGGEGINLHHNIHSIHIFCLIDFLANSQIIWLESSFRFDCPLCRSPVFGAVMMIS